MFGEGEATLRPTPPATLIAAQITKPNNAAIADKRCKRTAHGAHL